MRLPCNRNKEPQIQFNKEFIFKLTIKHTGRNTNTKNIKTKYLPTAYFHLITNIFKQNEKLDLSFNFFETNVNQPCCVTQLYMCACETNTWQVAINKREIWKQNQCIKHNERENRNM